LLNSPSRPFSLALAAGFALVLAGCSSETAEVAQAEADATNPPGELSGTLDRSQAGGELPDFALAALDGSETNLTLAKGTPTLVNLWATWCAPCVLEMPMLDELAATSEGQLRVIAVSQDLKGAEEVEPFLAERDLANLEIWLDSKNDLAFHYGGGGTVLPTTILYDAEGREVWRMVGGYDWSGEEARALVAEALPAG